MRRPVRRPRHPDVPGTRMTARDLVAESVAGILQRPARTALTVLGTLLGVGAFVAILGLTATARGQISSDFTVLAATQVTVKDVGAPDQGGQAVAAGRYEFPDDADQRVERLNGAVHAGTYWQVFKTPPDVSTRSGPATGAASGDTQGAEGLTVYAASPGLLRAVGPTLGGGALYNTFHDSRRMHVAVIGSAVARHLGIGSLAARPALFINGTPYTVVGILQDVERLPNLLLSVMIPERTARADYGDPAPDYAAAMLIQTRVGAAQLIARQAPLALRPDRPDHLQAVPPPSPHALQDSVTGSLDSLFLLLAGITLVIGTVGIANTTLVSVLERTGEIGLRRSLGARPRHIAAQFLTESAALGTLGGLLGTAVSIVVTLSVALAHHWTAILDPWTTLPAPLIGTLTGLLAGAYPALRAARIEPAEALRR
ncbi:ABC transporter permease [Streptomyces xanthochromogenes]|uniref:ABC transporter permease n=2 Tax=Streptomyces xanthochromogenes TaxID=67384 RepID=A0ABQ3ALM5_9ACTN|nr:ABC transporter permease [Streptomyces xanthochromogenes]GGY60652.1 ABC transporter permease [Streptomyces xanthochromogenes]